MAIFRPVPYIGRKLLVLIACSESRRRRPGVAQVKEIQQLHIGAFGHEDAFRFEGNLEGREDASHRGVTVPVCFSTDLGLSLGASELETYRPYTRTLQGRTLGPFESQSRVVPVKFVFPLMKHGSKTAVKQWNMTVPRKEASFLFYDGGHRMESPSIGVPFPERKFENDTMQTT